MDSNAQTPELMTMQTQLRYFYQLAQQCNEHCVSNYDTKNLDNEERACVETCYKKQMTAFRSLQTALGAAK